MIGVTGATGEVGGRVCARLAELGLKQRLIVRDLGRAPDLGGAEVARISGYDDTQGMRRALTHVEDLFLVSAGEDINRVRLHVAAVDAAVAAGVKRIVYLSFLGAAPDATFTFARDHWHTEEHIRKTGLTYTFLRSSLYLDFMPWFAAPDGVIRGPAGHGRFAPVTRADIADVAVAVLSGTRQPGTNAGGLDHRRKHRGQTYDMTGPEAMTMDEVASRLSDFIGREVRFENETLEEARASRASSGGPAWEIEGWVTSYAAIATGEFNVVTDTVARIAGHEPQTLEEFLETHPESYSHLL